MASPDKIIDPCTGGAGSHGSSRPSVTRRALAHLSPLTSHLLGSSSRPSQGRQLCKFLFFPNLFCCRTKRCGSERQEAVQRLSTLDFRGCGPQQTCPAAAHKHSTCLRTIVTFCIVSIFGQLQVKQRQWRALPTVVLRAEGRGSGSAGRGSRARVAAEFPG